MWFWIDEALTVGIAQQPVGEIPSLLRLDGSPPLYYLALHAWMRIFGDGEVATHALSLVFATLCVPVAFLAGRSLFDLRTGYMAAVVAAASPFLTHFARETRMYSLVTLLALVVSSSFVHAFVRGSRRGLVAFVVGLVALVYTHNWGLYVLAAAALALVPAAIAADRPIALLRRGAFSLGAVVLAYLPWALVLAAQIDATGAPWSFTPAVRQLVSEVAALVRDERVLFVLLVVVAAGLLDSWRRPRSADGAAAWALAIFVAAPIGLGWLAAHVEPSWATRYLAVVVGPLLLLVGFGLARAGSAGFIALAVAVVLWIQPLTRLEGNVRYALDAKSDAKALAASLDRRLADGDLVIVSQPEAVPLFAHYMEQDVRFATSWGEVEQPTVMDWRDAERRLEESNVSEHLVPLVQMLAPGARVALVGPGGRVIPTDTEWIRTFHRRHSTWRRALSVGPSTQLEERLRSARQDPLDQEGTPGPGADRDAPVAVPFSASIFEVVHRG